MFTQFIKAFAATAPLGVKSIQNLQVAAGMFRLSDAAAGQLLEEAAGDLERQPSVLGKLVFLCERAMPVASSSAKLRTKFPNWSFDTVTALQRAMLENLWRELCEDMPPDATPDPTTLAVLGLSEPDALRLMQDVADQKAAEAAAEAAKAEALEREVLAVVAHP